MGHERMTADDRDESRLFHWTLSFTATGDPADEQIRRGINYIQSHGQETERLYNMWAGRTRRRRPRKSSKINQWWAEVCDLKEVVKAALQPAAGATDSNTLAAAARTKFSQQASLKTLSQKVGNACDALKRLKQALQTALNKAHSERDRSPPTVSFRFTFGATQTWVPTDQTPDGTGFGTKLISADNVATLSQLIQEVSLVTHTRSLPLVLFLVQSATVVHVLTFDPIHSCRSARCGIARGVSCRAIDLPLSTSLNVRVVCSSRLLLLSGCLQMAQDVTKLFPVAVVHRVRSSSDPDRRGADWLVLDTTDRDLSVTITALGALIPPVVQIDNNPKPTSPLKRKRGRPAVHEVWPEIIQLIEGFVDVDGQGETKSLAEEKRRTSTVQLGRSIPQIREHLKR